MDAVTFSFWLTSWKPQMFFPGKTSRLTFWNFEPRVLTLWASLYLSIDDSTTRDKQTCSSPPSHSRGLRPRNSTPRMRLLKCDDTGEFSLDLVSDNARPPYAILSHTWGADAEEVSFKDMIDGTGTSKSGYDKIRFCGEQVGYDKLQICNTFGSTPAASISQIAPSFRRPSTPCFAGTGMRLSATCILPTSRDRPWALIASPVNRPAAGNHLFERAGGSPGGGPFKSLLLQRWSNSSLKKVNN